MESLPADGVILKLNGGVEVRAYRDEDAEAFAKHGSSRKVWDCLNDRIPHPYTIEDAKTWFDHNRKPENRVASGTWTLDDGSHGPAITAHYAIVVNGEACGSIGLEFRSGVYRKTAELGYWLGEEHHHKGFMSRVVPAFVSWTWSTFGILVRLDATAFDYNVGSQKVLQKAGFVYEGRRTNGCIKNGKICSAFMYWALRPET